MNDQERAADIARRIVVLQSDRDDIDEAIENLKAKLAEIQGAGEHIVGDNEQGFLKATVYQSRQFNSAFGLKNAPEIWNKIAEERKVVDATIAKNAIKAGKITEDEYALFQKPSDKGLSVKIEVLDE